MLHLLTLVILGIFCPIKSEPCLRENKACKLDAFNLVDVFENILEISECNEICKDNSECQYFSYHADEMIPSHYQKCYLFRLCNTVVDFPETFTGFTGLCTCSLDLEPQNGQLVKELYAETEIECKHSCQENEDCELYTFLEPASDCQLLRNVSSFGQSPIEGFHTGPGICKSEDGFCTFSLLDNNNNHDMLYNGFRTVRSGLLDCTVNVRIVLVGDGGDSYRDYPDFRGGGSGYVNATFANLYPFTVLKVSFHSDNVTILANGGLLLQSMAGESGEYNKGGDGYSGGGYGDYDGGMDGGDGQCPSDSPEYCGKGQGIDVQQLSTPHYQFTPGPVVDCKYGVSGGAGVIVNGEGNYGRGGGCDTGIYHRDGFAIFEILL